MNLGENIKKFRKERKLTQQQLSELSGVPKISIGRYERNETKPPVRVLTKLATTLQVPIDVLCDLHIEPIVDTDLGSIEGFKNIDTGERFENLPEYLKGIIDDTLPDEERYSMFEINKIYDNLLSFFKNMDIEFVLYMDLVDEDHIYLRGKLIDHKDGYIKNFENISEVEKFYNDIKFSIQSSVDRLKFIDKNNKEGGSNS